MSYRQGDIVFVPFPFTDLSSKKTRPALVLSNSTLKGTDLVLCGITSQKYGDQEVEIRTEDMQEGGLPLISYVKYGKIVTIDQGIIIGKLGCVSREKFMQIVLNVEKIIKSDL